MQFIGYLNEGKLTCGEDISRYLKNHKDGRAIIDIRFGSKITTAQLAYYWVVMDIVGKEYGYTKNGMSDYFKGLFLTEEVEYMGKVIPKVKSLTELTSKEMMDYLNNVIMRCADEGLVIPEATKEILVSNINDNARKVNEILEGLD